MLLGRLTRLRESVCRKRPKWAWQVDSPPWQCSCAICVNSLRVPGEEVHFKNGPSTLLTWLSPPVIFSSFQN
jgi:hypothetical protein